MRYLLILLAAFSFAAFAQQILYRYVDKDGRVVLSDHPPKGIPFEKVEYDRNTNVMESPKRSPPVREGKVGDNSNDRAKQRIKLRDQLRGAVDAARKRLAAAKEALEQGRDPKEDEWQPTVTQPDNGGKPNAKGVITGRGGRVVCNVDPHGRVVCPAVPVPSDGYNKRIEMLEQAVKDAEEALDAAETHYRRNAPD